MNRLSRYWRQIYGKRNQGYRRAIQYGFLIVIAWIGIEFSYFVIQLRQAMQPTVARPPGIEAFLPISSLISLKYWLFGGTFNDIHPSGLIILLVVLSTAVLLKRGFCSWVCPFGLLTEYLNRVHCFLFKKRRRYRAGSTIPCAV